MLLSRVKLSKRSVRELKTARTAKSMISKNHRLIKIVSALHPCVDRIGFLDWICRNRLEFWFFSVLRFGFSPQLLLSISERSDSLEERSRLHTLATSYLRAGNTVKTTGKSRTQHADRCVLTEADLRDQPRLLEVGVSDGSSTLELLEQKYRFSEIKLSDRYPHFYIKPQALGQRFYDVDRRTHGRKLLGLLINPLNPVDADITDCIKVESINPSVKETHGIETINYYDVFSSVEVDQFDIIKCSNLLNLIYFDESSIRHAIQNLFKSLKPEGCLIISQNNRKYKDDEAVICIRLQNDGSLMLYKQINDHDLLGVVTSMCA
jgi:SAM-dependent methyltransferase